MLILGIALGREIHQCGEHRCTKIPEAQIIVLGCTQYNFDFFTFVQDAPLQPDNLDFDTSAYYYVATTWAKSETPRWPSRRWKVFLNGAPMGKLEGPSISMDHPTGFTQKHQLKHLKTFAPNSLQSGVKLHPCDEYIEIMVNGRRQIHPNH